jgi:long-chain acyl-CoA synthetase
MATYLDTLPNIPATFFELAAKFPERPVYTQATVLRSGEREWRASTYRAVRERIVKFAAFLRERGVRPGDKVAIISNTRPEWLEADLAILSVGGVVVSVYQSLTAPDIGYILFDSGATVVIAENQEQVDKVLVLLAEPCAIPAHEDRPASEVRTLVRLIVAMESVAPNPIVVEWEGILARSVASSELPPAVTTIDRHALATLVYTSGTTGPPKGVMQTHGNHLSNIRQVFQAGLFQEEYALFLFLPLAHSFAKLIGYIGFLTPATLRFPAVIDRKSSRADPASISRDIREGGADVIAVVPRLLEKMEEGVMNRTLGGLMGVVLGRAIGAAKGVYRATKDRCAVSFATRLVYVSTTPLRRKIRAALFGERFRYAISGGAKLPVETAEFFAALGAEVLEGYGLTETCVATNVNRSGQAKIGTVGPVVAKDVEVRIESDGEICFRGPNVTQGYYNRPTATRSAWDTEGWFHTGDLGSLDHDGFLSIVGRKKELIVTAGGKKIPPEGIEQKLKASRFISQAVLMGEGKPYCVALVTLNPPEVRAHFAALGVTLGSELHSDKRVNDLVWTDVAAVNATLASFESVKRIFVVPEEMTVENGLLTPTFKVKRRAVANRFHAEFESLYSADGA